MAVGVYPVGGSTTIAKHRVANLASVGFIRLHAICAPDPLRLRRIIAVVDQSHKPSQVLPFVICAHDINVA